MNLVTLSIITSACIVKAATMDCSKIEKSALIQDGTVCKVVDATCLSKIDLTNIGYVCLKNINDDALANLNPITANQIMASTLNDIPAESRLMTALMKHNDWTKHPHEAFLSAAAQSRDHSTAFMEGLSSDMTTLARFFTESNADKHYWACTKLSKELVPMITTSFFSKMKKECFKAIPAEAFEGLDMDRFAAIRGELLRDISVQQAEKIPSEAFVNMTLDQIKNWGIPYEPPSDADKDAKTTYLNAHPCSQAKRMINSLKSEYRRNLKSQCKIKDSSAVGQASYSPAAFGSIIAIALAITLV